MPKKLREKIYNSISPFGYDNALDRMGDVFRSKKKDRNIDGISSKEVEETLSREFPDRMDAWAMYLGLPQKNNSFISSEYKPSKSTDSNAKYYKYTDSKKLDENFNAAKSWFDEGKDVDKILKEMKNRNSSHALGNIKMDYGEDKKGKYVSFYDKWDIHPFEKLDKDLGSMLGVGQPWEFYDRKYLTNNKEEKQQGVGKGNISYAQGGMIDQGQPNAELEKQEVTQGPDGSMQKMNMPSHTQATGKNQVALEAGTRIFSDKLKPVGEKKKTYADLADEIRKDMAKYEQMMYA
jgi:hypothetical protein